MSDMGRNIRSVDRILLPLTPLPVVRRTRHARIATMPAKKSRERTTSQNVDTFEWIDVLVNNAADQNHQESIEDLTDEQIERTFSMNIFGYFQMAGGPSRAGLTRRLGRRPGVGADGRGPNLARWGGDGLVRWQARSGGKCPGSRFSGGTVA